MRVGLKHHQSTSAALCINPMTQPRRQSCSVVLFHWATATARNRDAGTSGAVHPPLQQLKVRPPHRSQTSEGEPGFVVERVVMALVISDPSTGKSASRADEMEMTTEVDYAST